MKKIITFTFFLCFALPIFSQKYLQIEKVNRVKVKRYTIGATMTYRLKGEKEWLTREVTNIIPEENVILFDGIMVKADRIEAFRFERVVWQSIAKQLYRFGGGWLMYGAVADLFNQYDLTKRDFYIAGGSVVTAFIMQKSLKYRRTYFGERKRIRLIDLNFR